jgi:hypothetical protein
VSLRRPPRITFDGLRFARLTASSRDRRVLATDPAGCAGLRAVAAGGGVVQSDLIAVRPRLRTVAVDVVVDPEVVVLVGEVAERTERARASARVALRPDAQGLSRTVVAVTVGGRARGGRDGQDSLWGALTRSSRCVLQPISRGRQGEGRRSGLILRESGRKTPVSVRRLAAGSLPGLLSLRRGRRTQGGRRRPMRIQILPTVNLSVFRRHPRGASALGSACKSERSCDVNSFFGTHRALDDEPPRETRRFGRLGGHLQLLPHDMPPSAARTSWRRRIGVQTIRREAQTGTLEQEPLLVFAPEAPALPALELCVNFGLFASREVTRAEIDDLARELLTKVVCVTIVSERRYEIGADAEAAVHQLRVLVQPGALRSDQPDLAELRGRLLEITERWALASITVRNQQSNTTQEGPAFSLTD